MEIGVVNEIVRDAVDIPGNAYRIDESQNHRDPKRNTREKIKHPEEVRAVQKGGRDRDDVPARVGKDPGICPGTFDDCKLT